MPKEEQKAGPDYSMFEKLTDGYVSTLETQAPEFRDLIYRAWAKHTEGKKDGQGKGLGGALSEAANEYAKKSIYGITQEGQGNEDYQARLHEILVSATGLSKSALEKALDGENIVHAGDLEHILKIGTESLQKNKIGIISSKLHELSADEQKAFKGYVAQLAKDLGYKKVTEETLLTHKSAMDIYMNLIQEFAKQKLTQKARAEADLTGVANNTENFEEAAA